MKERRFDGSEIRRVVAGMVTDKTVLTRLAARWPREGLFAAVQDNLIGGWCVGYLKQFGRPPGRDIEGVFEGWAANRTDEATVELVRKRLEGISNEYGRNGEGWSSDYLLDVAGRLFRRVQVRRALEAADQDLETGDLDAAEKRLTDLRRVEVGTDATVRPGEDAEFWQDVFDEDNVRPLIWYPKDLGAFVGGELSRDSFVAFMGTAKRGKSFWLLDAAYRAARARHRVAYFEAGDLSRRQIGRRMGMRALRRPRPGVFEVKVPTIWKPGPKTDLEVRQAVPISDLDCYREWRRMQRGEDLFRLQCHSNRSLTVAKIEGQIREWASDGWTPDAVVIDYADILAPPAGVREGRDQINENWMHLRRLSQDWHCLVLTATQSDAAGYDARLLKRKNFSDDRRKHDHVTAMLGLNSTDGEKEQGMWRLNWIDRRDAAQSEKGQVWVAGCLEIACPVVISTTRPEFEDGSEST